MKKAVPTATSQKKDTGSASTSTHPPRSDATMSKAEITAIVEKTVADTLARQMSDFQTEVTKSTKQEVQNLSDRLLELGDKSVDANAKNLKHFAEVENTLRDLHQRCVLLEKLVKEELGGIVEEKVRLTLQKIHPESEVEKEKGKWSEQLASIDSSHQQEIQKLHQQHHQDMLSVINDCCRKLKSSFTRQHKPYEVDEIHAVIDDIEQKMIREILFEIEKTDTHEDLRSFEEALVTSELSGEVSEGRQLERERLTSDEIAASLSAFEKDNIGSFSEEFESTGAAVDELKPVIEENISSSRAMITGDRGNIYYAEELKRTVDDIIALDEKTGVNPNEAESVPDLPPKTRSNQDVEESLESLIISGDAEKDFESCISKGLEEKEKEKAVVGDVKLGGQGKASEIPPEMTSHDPDILKSLEAMVEDDISWADIQPPSKSDADESKRFEVVVNPFATTPATTTRDQDLVKSLEGKLETDTRAPALSPRDADKLKSLEGKLEPEPSAKSTQDQAKSRDVINPVTTAPTASTQDRDLKKSLEGKLDASAPAFSPRDLDKLKSLEGKLDASAPAFSPRDADKLKSLEGKLEPKPSAKSTQDQAKSRDVVINPVTTAPSASTQDRDLKKPLEGKLDASAPAFSPRDTDKLKSLEGKLEPEPRAKSAHDQIKSHEEVINPVTTTPSTSTQDRDLKKSLKEKKP